VAGVLVAESPRVREATLDALDSVIIGVFAPIFFVYTGLWVTSLASAPATAWVARCSSGTPAAAPSTRCLLRFAFPRNS
jgi:Kef-type K+ transport system membrane component KefB